jgi:hypothetical protein
MRWSWRLLAVAALGVMPAAPAWAEDDQVVKAPDQVVYEKRTVIDFGEKTMEGELAKPQASYVLERRPTRFGSMLWIRHDFERELRRSVDEM